MKYFMIGFTTGLVASYLVIKTKQYNRLKSKRAFTILNDGSVKIYQ